MKECKERLKTQQLQALAESVYKTFLFTNLNENVEEVYHEGHNKTMLPFDFRNQKER